MNAFVVCYQAIIKHEHHLTVLYNILSHYIFCGKKTILQLITLIPLQEEVSDNFLIQIDFYILFIYFSNWFQLFFKLYMLYMFLCIISNILHDFFRLLSN